MRLSDVKHRMPECNCLGCGRKISGVSGIDDDARPSPGDFTVCMYCGHTMVFADDLTVREPTLAEYMELFADERVNAAEGAVRLAGSVKDPH